MPIAFNCSCGERLEVDDELAGQQARCPYCEGVVSVPAGTSPPPAKRARLADPDETDDDRGAFAGSLNPDDRNNRRDTEYRPRRRSSYDRDDNDDDYRPRRSYQPAPYNPLNKQVVGGIVSVIIGVGATVIVFFLGGTCYWGLIVAVFGVIAIIRGLASGRDN
jgi:hypothetical protein